MTEFKIGDKLWWVCEEMGRTDIYPIVVTCIHPSETGVWAKLSNGLTVYPYKAELYQSHSEAVETSMKSDAFEFDQVLKEQGWR